MKTKNKNQQPAREYSSELIKWHLSLITPEEQEQTNKRMGLAAKIDDAIKDKGWNYLRFSNEMNKKPSEISKWLSGTHNFTVETLVSIEQKLGIQLIDCSTKRTKRKSRQRTKAS